MIKVPGHRILIDPKPLEREKAVEGTETKIIIAYGENEKRIEAGSTEGYVVALGSECYLDKEPWCKVGDYVLFARYSGVWVNDPEDKKLHVIINDEDVLCVLNSGEK